jgi:hypothetical protein
MKGNTRRIDFSASDESVNRILRRETPAPGADSARYSCCFNQNEDQFLLLEKPVTIPSFPIHHAIENRQPPPGYTAIIKNLCEYLMENFPSLAADTVWYFDPSVIHSPSFYRIVTVEGQKYLYLLMIDLTCRPLESRIIEVGSNNRTHAYQTNRLYFECDYLPVEEVNSSGNSITLSQTIPVTWKGEAGQGYMLHGIWMDSDINKFFSKLILPAGKRIHPYYPVTCKQHCVSMNAFGQHGPELFHRIRKYIEPSLESILAELQTKTFSEQLPLFVELKKKIPSELGQRWKNLDVQIFLNEYTVEF